MYLLDLEKVSLDFRDIIELQDVTVVITPDIFSGKTFDSKIPDFFMYSGTTKGFREKYPNIIVVRYDGVYSNVLSLEKVQKYLNNFHTGNTIIRLNQILRDQEANNLNIDLNKIFFYFELPETGLTPVEQYEITRLFSYLIRKFDCKILIRTINPDLVQCMQFNMQHAPNKKINFVLGASEETYYRFYNYNDSIEEVFQFFNKVLDLTDN